MMKIFVNDQLIDILPGMTIRHALIRTGLLKELENLKKVYDEWENEVGLEGALSEGMKIYVR